MSKVSKHFVTFYSPGTFVYEHTTKEIKSWDVDLAVKMSKKIKERYDAIPIFFQFSTRSRGKNDLDSKETKRSKRYYINCKVKTYQQIVERNDPNEEILRSNMRINKFDRIASPITGWKAAYPLEKGDVVL